MSKKYKYLRKVFEWVEIEERLNEFGHDGWRVIKISEPEFNDRHQKFLVVVFFEMET